ncbi:MAG: hypothetical protein IJ724_03855 [Muribaculaceae bacterium]|nr:hypothetical protein [Muribaculaceae bacterium]
MIDQITAIQALIYEAQVEDYGTCHLDDDNTIADVFLSKHISGAVRPKGLFMYVYRDIDDLPYMLRNNVDIHVVDHNDESICLFKLK